MHPDPKSQTQKRKRTRHEFLLTFFEDPQVYEVEVNNYILIKQLNPFRQWEVAVFTKEAYNKRKQWLLRDKEAEIEPLPMA